MSSPCSNFALKWTGPIAGRQAKVRNLFGNGKPAFHPTLLRNAEMAGDALDGGIVDAIRGEFAVGREQLEDRRTPED
jgi:hypothetical protein